MRSILVAAIAVATVAAVAPSATRAGDAESPSHRPCSLGPLRIEVVAEGRRPGGASAELELTAHLPLNDVALVAELPGTGVARIVGGTDLGTLDRGARHRFSVEFDLDSSQGLGATGALGLVTATASLAGEGQRGELVGASAGIPVRPGRLASEAVLVSSSRGPSLDVPLVPATTGGAR